MTTIFFSIIIPTYNRAYLLRKAIESVLAQTFSDWELLIVDDGSTDNTKEVVQSYAAKDARIKYIYQKNSERSAARNKGIQKAVGDYICFLDSDDYYLQERLQQLADYLAETKQSTGFFFTGLLVEQSPNEFTRVDFLQDNQSVYDFIATHPIHCQQVCISSNILKQIPFDERFSIGEDSELWLRICNVSSPLYIENQFTVVVVEHEDRSVNLKKYNSALKQLETIRFMLAPNHPGNKVSPQIKKQLLGTCYFSIAKYHIYHSSRVAAIRYMILSLTSDIRSPQWKFRLNILYKLITFSSLRFLRRFVG